MLTESKTVLVSGATGSIGQIIVKYFIEKKMTVIGHNRNGYFKFHKKFYDMLDHQDGDGLNIVCNDGLYIADKLEENFVFKVDIVVNAVGGAGDHESWSDTTSGKWNDVYNSNVLIPFNQISKVVPSMKIRNWGRIINIASVAGIKPLAIGPEYSAAKAALINGTVSLAKDLANTGITANCISPGLVDTEAVREMIEKNYSIKFDDNGHFNKFVSKNIFKSLTGKLTKVDGILAVIEMLCSDGGENITAQNIVIDGGYSVI